MNHTSSILDHVDSARLEQYQRLVARALAILAEQEASRQPNTSATARNVPIQQEAGNTELRPGLDESHLEPSTTATTTAAPTATLATNESRPETTTTQDPTTMDQRKKRRQVAMGEQHEPAAMRP